MNDNRELAATNGRLAALSCGVFAVVLCGVQIDCSAGISTRLPRNIPTAYKYAKLKPAGSGQAAITGGYLLPYIDRSMDRGVLDYLDKFEEHGFIENFRIVGKKLEKMALVEKR